MPRSSMSGPKQLSLLDHLSLGAVMNTYTQAEIEEVLNEVGSNSVRRRLIPAFVVFYLVVMQAMYNDVSVKENLRIILEGLRRRFGSEKVKIAVGSAITKGKQRLGKKPFEVMFEKFVKPAGTKEHEGCFYKGLRIVAVDSSTLSVQNTKENREHFGVHSNQFGEIGYPYIKFVSLVECGTRIIFAARTGQVHTSENELFEHLIGMLDKGLILLADRLYYNFAQWKKCDDSGAKLLWRVYKTLGLKPVKELEDGSYMARIKPSARHSRRSGCDRRGEMLVRVIEYQIEYADGSLGENVRLITNLFNHSKTPACELACLYAQRWNIETGFDELKNHLKASGKVLRSQLPELVEQEFYGLLLAYYVVRKVMADAALLGGIPPTELSFVHTVRVIKRRLTDKFPPCDS